jgi:tRNA threonylcarbamoyladenosine biosynthesis protein TsaE
LQKKPDLQFENIPLEKMQQVADYIFAQKNAGNIICFEGNLGAGKTTLIKLLALKMNLVDAVQSPTFGYVNTYDKKVHHFDCYRLERLEEALDLGFEEYFDDDKQIWIEWPSVILPLLPKPFLEVRIEHVENGNRTITVNTIL